MVGKVFKNWKKVALEKNCCKNQYILIKLLLKVKNQGVMLGGRSCTYFKFLAKNFNIFNKIPYNSKNSLFTICNTENVVQENMAVSCGYIARGRNSLVSLEKWLILKTVKLHVKYMI